MGRMSLFTSKC